MRLGHGQRRSVLILWAWTALLSGFVLYPTSTRGRGDAVVPFGVAALGLLLYTVFHPGVRRARRGTVADDGMGDDDADDLDERPANVVEMGGRRYSATSATRSGAGLR